MIPALFRIGDAKIDAVLASQISGKGRNVAESFQGAGTDTGIDIEIAFGPFLGRVIDIDLPGVVPTEADLITVRKGDGLLWGRSDIVIIDFDIEAFDWVSDIQIKVELLIGNEV